MQMTDKNPEKQHDKRLWDQFCRLGEMMGDGLHHEPDGKWIAREYRQLSKILIPEIKKEHSQLRKIRAANINVQMAKLLENKKCDCGDINRKPEMIAIKRMRSYAPSFFIFLLHVTYISYIFVLIK